ncbi:MAG: hypothetical protein M1158_02480 [Candidatus Marsarchaeota archaeon]|nr:hypothetical protein [Candidatus Marsarchaeota archaeon]
MEPTTLRKPTDRKKLENSKAVSTPFTAERFVDMVKALGELDAANGEPVSPSVSDDDHYIDTFVKIHPSEFNRVLELSIDEYKNAVKTSNDVARENFEYLLVCLCSFAIANKNGDAEYADINPSIKLLTNVLWLPDNDNFEANDTKKKLIEAFQPLRKRGSEEESEE